MESKKKNYDFGEKKTESYQGQELPVWQSPKYLEAKKGVIEILESEQYKGVLKVSDFWILMNTYSNKTKMMYTGLIISHNGCLKINDLLENKFKPECVSLDKEGYNNSLVYTYQDEEVYEVGEVSKSNCKNDYPYAMALKRCFDRVVLKKCKLAYKGIYSDSEADEFTEKLENKEVEEINYRNELIKYCKENNIDMNEIAKEYKLNAQSNNEEFEKALNELEFVNSASIQERLGQ